MNTNFQLGDKIEVIPDQSSFKTLQYNFTGVIESISEDGKNVGIRSTGTGLYYYPISIDDIRKLEG